jgi:hypothetical protein
MSQELAFKMGKPALPGLQFGRTAPDKMRVPINHGSVHKKLLNTVAGASYTASTDCPGQCQLTGLCGRDSDNGIAIFALIYSKYFTGRCLAHLGGSLLEALISRWRVEGSSFLIDLFP